MPVGQIVITTNARMRFGVAGIYHTIMLADGLPAQEDEIQIPIRRSLVGWLVSGLLQPPPIAIHVVTTIKPQLSLPRPQRGHAGSLKAVKASLLRYCLRKTTHLKVERDIQQLTKASERRLLDIV